MRVHRICRCQQTELNLCREKDETCPTAAIEITLGYVSLYAFRVAIKWHNYKMPGIYAWNEQIQVQVVNSNRSTFQHFWPHISATTHTHTQTRAFDIVMHKTSIACFKLHWKTGFTFHDDTFDEQFPICNNTRANEKIIK